MSNNSLSDLDNTTLSNSTSFSDLGYLYVNSTYDFYKVYLTASHVYINHGSPADKALHFINNIFPYLLILIVTLIIIHLSQPYIQTYITNMWNRAIINRMYELNHKMTFYDRFVLFWLYIYTFLMYPLVLVIGILIFIGLYAWFILMSMLIYYMLNNFIQQVRYYNDP